MKLTHVQGHLRIVFVMQTLEQEKNVRLAKVILSSLLKNCLITNLLNYSLKEKGINCAVVDIGDCGLK